MNIEDVFKALKSCDINPEKHEYGHQYGTIDSFYIKNNKYYHSFPDNYDRPQEIIEKELKSETEFIICYLTYLNLHYAQKKKSLIYILSSLCENKYENTLKTNHINLFELHNPIWKICKKNNYQNPWKFNIISKKGELFNQIYNYGIGFINSKYIVERQGPYTTGDKPQIEYDCFIFDNYYDAYLQLEKYANLDILERQIIVDKIVQSYKMDEEEHKIAQEMCNLLNNKTENSINKFTINQSNTNNIVFIRDYGYYSFIVNEKEIPESANFHTNGQNIEAAIRSFCKTYKINY